MPINRAQYKRGHSQTKGRGHQPTVFCSFCGRKVPRHKTFIVYKSFRINDPVIKREIDFSKISTYSQQQRACPACARHRRIVQKRDSRGIRKNIRKRR